MDGVSGGVGVSGKDGRSRVSREGGVGGGEGVRGKGAVGGGLAGVDGWSPHEL